MRRIESEIKRANRALEEMNPFHRFSPEEGLYEYPEEVLFDALYQIYEILLIVTEESELPLYRQELINNWNYFEKNRRIKELSHLDEYIISEPLQYLERVFRSISSIQKGGGMTQNHSGQIHINGNNNILQYGNGNIHNSVTIENFLVSLKEKIDSSDSTQDEKSETKGILEKVTTNPLLIGILENSIPELIKLFTSQS